MGIWITIRAIENSDETPSSADLPETRWGQKCTLGDKYLPALAIEDPEAAGNYLLCLVGHSLRFVVRYEDAGPRALTWREAFELERDGLAWMALARDVSRMDRAQSTVRRVGELFGAFLPESVSGARADQSIGETAARAKAKASEYREKKLKRRTNPYAQADAQKFLFEK